MKKLLIISLIMTFASFVFAADIADLEKKASAGDAQSQYELGMEYLNGDNIEPNIERAVQLFEQAAKRGHPEAQYEYGTAMFYGDGIKADKIMGCAWLYLSTVDSSEYICLSQIGAEDREKAKAESEKLAKSIK